MLTWILYVVAAVIGGLSVVQAGSNTTMKRILGAPLWAMVLVSAVTFIISLAAVLVAGEKWPAATAFAKLPWWAWIGGLMGFLYVVSMIYIADRIGAASFTGLTVTAALLVSIAMDHYGVLGFETHPAGTGRLVGGALMVIGIALISKF